MKKYILLSMSLLTLHIVYGQETWKEYRVKYIEDSIKKEIRDKDKFKVSISKNDTTFTYIPKQWGTMPESDQKMTPKLKATKSISSYELSFIPSTFIIDYSKDIGEIDIVENENTRGSLSYSVPIYSYSNFNVNSPPISLVYNSMAGNGIAGKGWLISGLSAITITNNTIYHDSRTESGKRNKNSAFSLDGSRLINLNTGTATTINYQTEFGNVSVTAYLVNNEIAYFTVRKPDGTVGTYGYTGNTVTNDCYPLTEIVDKQGSYATFNYSKANNIYFINSIYYGGKKNTASGHFAWLTFTYETRPDVETTYVDGLECKLDKRVTEISSYVNSQLLRTYAFSYENKRISLLKRIDCKNGTKYLNPIYFYYGKNNQITQFVKTNTILTSYFSNSLPKDIRFQKANFNTYLNSDALVAYPDINTYDVVATKYRGNTPIAYQYGTRFHEDQTLLIYDDVSSSISVPASITAGNGFLRLFPIDIDGDGIDELVKMNYHFSNSTTEQITFTVYDVVNSMGTAVLQQRYLFTGDYGGVVNWEGLLSPARRIYLLGDFLGNGKTNILSISYNKNVKDEAVSSWATLVDIYGRQKSPTHDKVCFNFEPNDYVFAFDFDGDGKTDVCHIGASATKIYTFNTSGSLVEIASFTGITRSNLANREILINDINGDGKMDILLSPLKDDFIYKKAHIGTCMGCCSKSSHDRESADGSVLIYFCDANGNKTCMVYRDLVKEYKTTAKQWYLAISTGKGFVGQYLNICYNDSDTKFALQDMNGDNRADLVVREGGSVKMYLAKAGLINTTAETQSCAVTGSSYLIPGGLHNGTGMGQLFSIYNHELSPIKFTVDHNEEELLTGVVNSFGVINKHTYTSTKDANASDYDKGTKCGYPFMNLTQKIFLYTGTNKYIANTLKESASYSYKRGVVELQGRGFTGFEEIKAYDNMRNTQVIYTFNPLSYGQLTKVDSPKETINLNYTVNVPANRISKVTLSSKSEYNKLRGTTISYTYTYDTYDNVTQEIINYGSNIKTTADYTYSNSTSDSNYRLGTIVTKTVKKERTGNVYTEKEYISDFTTGTGLPAVVIYYVNGLQKAEVINTYESGTNYLTQESWKHYDAASRQVTQYLYDSKGMVLKKTDPAGITTTYSYDAKNRLQKEKDHLNNGTDYEYDVWDRVVKTIWPSGEITTNASIWATNAAGSLYMSQTVTSGKPVIQVYYDPLNREVRKGEMRFDGRYLYTDIAYDNLGRKQKQSLPYIGSDPVRWNTFNYDIYDRNTSVVFASGRTDTYSYSANSITSVTEGISKVYTYDVAGLLTTLADPGGTTTYVYRADGKPASVNVAGAVTTLEYDNYGRQTAIVDPGAGRKTFTYDTAGNLATDTDARGKTTKLGYDGRNRLIRKEFVGEQTITYTYNQNNFLVSEVSTNGTSAYFTPDSLLRVKTVKETGADGNWLQKDFTYSYGNIYTIAYAANTGSIVTETYKYANGHLSELLAGSISVWKLTKENDMGQQAEVKNNNTVLVQTYSYDDYGLPKTRMVKNSGNTVIQDDIYTFNAQNGNLSSRKDNKRNLLENFTYDNMHRLTGFSGKTVTYDNRGNITNISDVGSMSYSSVKPYQMTAMPLMASSIYPQRSQLISYNTMMLPTSIIENGYTAAVAYNGGGERVKMELKKNNVAELTRYYLGNQYEKDSGVAGTKEKLYIGGDPYSAAAVMVKEGTGSWQIHYLCRDYLGSITQIVNAAGNLVQELSYDAWGRLRNPLTQALYAADSEPALFLGRGYTGHEHMPWFALINMNARLYDSVLCRFLTPDPYIVSLEFSQLFNRYSYGANNPLRFTDPTGKFPWLAFGIAALVVGIVSVTAAALAGEIHSIGDGLKAFFTGAFVGAALVVTWYYLPAVPYVGKFLAGALKIYAIAQAATATIGVAGGLIHDAMGGFKDLNGLENAVKLFYGNFYFNNRGLRGPVEGYLRHTWEMLQNFGGHAFAMGRNMFGFVDRVDYFGGATFATNENSKYHNAISLSGYININIWEEIDRPFNEFIMSKDPMYMHEYGHRHDSRLFGYLYLFAIGIPSAAGAQYTEIWANRNAKNYFKKFGINWDLYERRYPTK